MLNLANGVTLTIFSAQKDHYEGILLLVNFQFRIIERELKFPHFSEVTLKLLKSLAGSTIMQRSTTSTLQLCQTFLSSFSTTRKQIRELTFLPPKKLSFLEF